MSIFHESGLLAAKPTFRCGLPKVVHVQCAIMIAQYSQKQYRSISDISIVSCSVACFVVRIIILWWILSSLLNSYWRLPPRLWERTTVVCDLWSIYLYPSPSFRLFHNCRSAVILPITPYQSVVQSHIKWHYQLCPSEILNSSPLWNEGRWRQLFFKSVKVCVNQHHIVLLRYTWDQSWMKVTCANMAVVPGQ